MGPRERSTGGRLLPQCRAPPDTRGGSSRLPGGCSWITNEELILLRAEIRWFTGDKPGAISDIDLIRQYAGGLPPTTLTIASTDAEFITELLYNRTYSLLWEQGTRWIDARRYDRIGPNDGAVRGGAPGSTALPIDRAGDVVHPQMLVPAGECDARGLPVPCTV